MLLFKLHTGLLIDFKKIIARGGERSTRPIKIKTSLELFKVGAILTMFFFQTSWNLIFQKQFSKVTILGVCPALILWNLIFELVFCLVFFTRYRISRTNMSNFTDKESFSSNFWKKMHYNGNRMLFRPTPRSKGPTKRPLRPTQRLDQSLWKASEAFLPSSQRALVQACKGINEVSVWQQTALPVT